MQVLRGLGLLDTAPDPAFDELTRLAADLLGARIALISLVDEHRQWFKSAVGAALVETPREHAFCAHAILQPTIMEVRDAREDLRFRDNPLVTGEPRIRFYASVPLSVDGHPMGTLCVIDREPRRLDSRQRATLERLGSLAARQLAQHRAARDAASAHARLADFLASSGDWQWETEGLRVRWVSDNIRTVLGIAPADYVGHLIVESLVDESADARAANALALAAIRANRPFRDLRIRRSGPDGVRIVSKSGVPVLDAQGRAVGYRGVSCDVTGTAAANRQAALAESRLREAVEALEEPVVMTDPAGRIVLTNARWREHYVSPGEPVPEHFHAHLRALAAGGRVRWPALGADASAVERRLASMGASADPFEVEVGDSVFVCRDLRLPDGSCVTVGQDITAMRAEHRAAVDAARRLGLAVSAAGLRICEADLDTGELRSVVRPPEAEDLLPVPATVAEWLESVDPVDRSRIETALRELWDGRRERVREEVALLHAGARHHLKIDVVLEVEGPGGRRRLVSVRHDVTELRRAEESARLKTAADLANRAKSEFLSRVGHELRTPLNAIRGLAQVLQRENADDPAARQTMLGHVVTASEHLAALLDDLLDMAQVEAGRLTIRAAPVSVAAVVRDTLRMMAPQAAGHGITVECGRLPDGLRVMADATRLRQILLNLVSNAVKYNRPQGRVRLDAALDARSGCATISVTDTGQGLTPDEMIRVFKPFERLASRGHGDHDGLGLGLAIAQGLAQAMGGSLVVDSEPGRGATFTVQLPAAADAAREPAPVDGAPPPAVGAADVGTTPRRVLYVEDNRLNGVLMKQIARQIPGLMLQVVERGEEALEMLDAFAPDLLLLDNDLPGISGLETHRRVKADARWAALRVVLVSADATAEGIARARALGFDDYWVKPIDVARVLDALGGAPGPARQDQPAET